MRPTGSYRSPFAILPLLSVLALLVILAQGCGAILPNQPPRPHRRQSVIPLTSPRSTALASLGQWISRSPAPD